MRPQLRRPPHRVAWLDVAGGQLIMTNSIVAGITGSGMNISGSFAGALNLTGGLPLLAPLGNYGGPTQTMPPLAGSPALGTAVNLTYTANSASMFARTAVPALSGSVSGFVGSDSQASATTGTVTFTTTATSSSESGRYAITGSGLTADNGSSTAISLLNGCACRVSGAPAMFRVMPLDGP
jgi:hypothetical protein